MESYPSQFWKSRRPNPRIPAGNWKSGWLAFLFILEAAWLQSAVPVSWQPRGIGGGGALFSPSINPANSDEYYVACDMSELFHSVDFGLSYSVVPFGQLQGGHFSRMGFSQNPSIRYCLRYNGDVATPAKSTDGGATWSVLPGNPYDGDSVYSLWVDYDHPDRVAVAGWGEIYFSADGGNSFRLIHTAAGDGIRIGGAFFDGNSIFLGTNDGLLVSTNGGTNFGIPAISGIPAGEAIYSFAGGKSGGTLRFFCLTLDAATIAGWVDLPASEYWEAVQGIYRLDYGAGGWTACPGGLDFSTDFPMHVAMAWNDINTVYLAGSNSSGELTVFKTGNAGTSWVAVFLTGNNQNITTGWCGEGGDRGWGYAECAFGLAVAPTDANRVLVSDFGFVHATSNGGTNWRQAYLTTAGQNEAGSATPPNRTYESCGLENTSCWQILWTGARQLFAGYSDIRGLRSTDGGAGWSFDYTGHTANTMYRLVRHPGSGILYAGTSNIHDLYQSTRLADNILDSTDGGGKIIFSGDDGKSWQQLHYFGHPVFWLTLDPSNTSRMYASVVHSTAGGIYATSDLQNGASSIWTKLPAPPRTEGHPACLNVLADGTLVATYSGRRTASGFTASSGVFVFQPGTGTWSDVSHPGMHYWTKDLTVDPHDSSQNTWYAGVFSGWGGPPNGLGGLYRTTDRGAGWTRINALDRVTALAIDPTDPGEAWLTTETDGLWHTENLKAGNPVFSLVENYPFRQPERIFFNPYTPGEIWVTSFGHGMRVGCQASHDLDGDGDQDEEDHRLLAEYLAGSRNLIPAGEAAADVNGDGLITVLDLILLDLPS